MRQFVAEITENQRIAEGYYEIAFAWGGEAEPLPGQFVSLMSFGTTDLILRRPFAVSSFREAPAEARVIYQRKGAATTALAARLAGERIDIIAPLGNGFPHPTGGRPILVGGGVGLGPILFLGNRLVEAGMSPRVILGFRSADLVPDLRPRCRFEPLLCTDDGSFGFPGTVVARLRALPAEDIEGAELFVCGPNPMMAACHGFATDHRLDCWVSMEQIMGCGVGACMGCAIPVAGNAYARVCTEGPVFSSRTIAWTSL